MALGSIVVLSACSSSDTPSATSASTTVPGTTSAPAPTTTAPTPTTAGPAGPQRLEMFGGPDWLAADDAFVYVKLDSRQVDRLDPETGELLGETELGDGDRCQGLGVGFGSVWSCDGTDIVRVDPSTDSVVASIPVNKTFNSGNLVAAFGRLWVLVGDGSNVVGIDPETNSPGQPISLGAKAVEIAADDSYLYALDGFGGRLLRIDPASGTVVGTLSGLAKPVVLEAGAGGIWVAGLTDTVRIDPLSFTVTATVPVGSGPDGAITAAGNDVWIRDATGSRVVRVDAATGDVVDDVALDLKSGGDVIVAHGAVWTTGYDDSTLIRIPVQAS